MTDRPIRVAIVDDQELIRTGFSLILNTAAGEPHFDVVGEAAEGAEALELISRLDDDGSAPDVVLMDVRMPGMNGIQATGQIAERFPGVRVLVLTTFDLDEYAMEAIQAGASGFLLKDTRAAELIEAVRAVADGDAVMAPSVTQRLLLRLKEVRPQQLGAAQREPAAAERAAVIPGAVASPRDSEDAMDPLQRILHELTDREQEVFGLIAEGLSNAEIGERLFLSESTVKTHVGRVLTKLGLRDRVHAVILAYEAGLRGSAQ
ncbi:MAG: response regulator transcription factor [Actinobacteria bacterium]|nr:response regulator transcription factor [Actinomycetota bacterium]